MSDKIYDVIIIGGGPAGLSAAVYTAREKLSTILLEKGTCGGWPNIADIIENYPGFPEGIAGKDLANRFKAQAQKFKAELVEFAEVKKITIEKNNIKAQTDKKDYNARTLIVASGASAKRLGIPGEEEYTGRGVSYCATCDGPLFKDKDVIVVGGGNAAAEEALFLTKFARSVTVIHRRDELRATKILQEELMENKKIKLLLSHNLVSISSQKIVHSVIVKNNKTDEKTELKVQGVFIYIGFMPNSSLLKGIVELDADGYIKTDENMKTSKPGIFAAGDIRSKAVRQIVTACAEGTIAAISVRDYLKQ